MAKKPFNSVEEFNTKPYFDEDGVQVASGIGKDGKEYPDPVPMAPPIGYQAPPDLMTLIRQMIRAEEFKRLAAQEDFETFEESDDFDIEDDPLDPHTPYEAVFDPAPPSDGPQVPASPPAPPAVKVAEGAAAGGSPEPPPAPPPGPKPSTST